MTVSLSTRRRALVVALCLGLLVVALSAMTASAAPFPAPYLNGFENAADVTPLPSTADADTMFGVSRVSSGTNGVTSADGLYHATVPVNTTTALLFTRLGGYQSVFPSGGYTVSVDIYLDTGVSGIGEDKRMAWTVASNGTDGAHQRDFVFSIGTNGTGGYVMSASNNAPGNPADPGRDPFTITTTGWYTFKHRFYNNSGVLAVEMSVLDAGGIVLHTWAPLSNPADTIPAEVGGNRYGWFYSNDFLDLPIDNVTRSGTCTTVCYADVVNGDDANDGISPATAKKTIQAAVDTVQAGGEVRVLPGSYPESPDLDKSVTLVSTGGRDVTFIELQTGTNYTHSLLITGADVTVDGFTIVGIDGDAGTSTLAATNIYVDTQPDNVVIKNNRFQVGAVDPGYSTGDDGFGVISETSGNPDVATLLVEDNIFEPLNTAGQRAFYINPSVVDFTFRGNEINGQFNGTALTEAQNNLIEDNTITGTGASGGLGIWGYLDPGLWGTGTIQNNTITGTANAISIYDAEDVTVTKNILDGNGRGVRVLDAAFVSFDLSTIHINRNAITNNTTIGVLNSVGDYDTNSNYIGDTDVYDVDAICNWWGDASGPGPVGAGSGDGVSTDVDFDPFLTTDDLDGPCYPIDAYFFSAKTAGSISGMGAFGSEDILMYDGSDWSIWFDGSFDAGLNPKKTYHNIDAFSIPDPLGDDLFISFTRNQRPVPGINGIVDGMDVVQWDGAAFSLLFDGQDAGLQNLTAENVDSLHVLPGSEWTATADVCLHYLLISTKGAGNVPAIGGGLLKFSGEDVLGFCLTQAGADTTGLWTMVLDGSTVGMNKGSTDSISLSADGNTLFLTTLAKFTVNGVVMGIHSRVYVYDMVNQTFAGPIFIAPAEGLTKVVDGLHISE